MKLNINPKNIKKYSYVILGTGSILAIIFILRTIVPDIRFWISLHEKTKHREAELQKRYETVKENEKLKLDIKQIQEKYGDINKQFFSLDNISAAVKEIADISQNLRIDYISLTPQENEQISGHSPDAEFSLWKTPILIEIKLDYLKLMQFLKGIENAKKFIRVEVLKIKKDPENLRLHDVEMTVYAFSLQKK